MKIRLPPISLADTLKCMREYEDDDTIALELIGYIWGSMPESSTRAVMRYLMAAHDENGEPWPTKMADLEAEQ